MKKIHRDNDSLIDGGRQRMQNNWRKRRTCNTWVEVERVEARVGGKERAACSQADSSRRNST